MSGAIAAALRIVVLLLSGATRDPAQQTLLDATRQALGPNAEIEIVALPRSVDEQTVQTYAAGAQGLVQVRWSSDRRHATLRFYSNAQGAPSERAVDFDANDPESEKGLHLGLLIGSLFDPVSASDEQAATPSAQTATSPEPAASTNAKPAAATQRDNPALRVGPIRRAAHDADFAGSTHASAWTFEATLLSALGGAGGGLGANIGFRARLIPKIYWRLNAGAQTGEVVEARATTKSVRATSGVEWIAAASSRFELGLHAELLASWLQVAHLSDDDPGVDRKQRLNAGLDVFLGAGFQVSQSSAIVVRSGLELLSGETQLFSHGQRVATLSRARWLTGVGFRVEY